ncbi:MAG: PAS domain S-box protein [Gemmatimonadetes bacterium]|nr:PAS domain S-box protein [Gemmatimonadota bacterium]
MTRRPRRPKRKPARHASVGPDLQRTLASIGAGPITLIDATGMILYTSPAVLRLLGYEPAEREGQSVMEIIHPDDRDRAQHAFADLAGQPGMGMTADVRCRRKDGTYRTLEVVALNRLADPEIQAIVTTYRDVTERRQLEQRVRASEERYRLLFNENPMPGWVVDRQTLAFLAVNQAAIEKYGYTEEEFLSMTVADIRPSAEVIRPDANVAPVSPTSAPPGFNLVPGVRRHRTKDGQWIDVEVFQRPISFDDHPALLVLVNDITERRRAQATLAEREMLLEAIVEASPECLKVVASDGTVLQMNRAGLAMLDATCMEELPRSIIELVAPEHRPGFQAMAARVFAGQSAQLEFEVIGLKGSRRWVESHAMRLEYPGRGDPVMVAVTRDITKRKQAEDALRESEKLYRTLFESAPLGLGIADTDGTLLAFNDAIRAPGGYSEADIRAIGNVARLYADSAERDRLLAKSRAEGRLHREPVQFLRQDGSKYDALMSLEPVQIGGRHGWLAVVEDVSQQKRAEAAELQAEERYLTFFAHSDEAFWRIEFREPCPITLPEEEQIEHFYRHAYLAEGNDAMARMYGYASSAEMVGRGFEEVLRRDDLASLAALRDLIRSGYQQTNVEVRERDRMGAAKIFSRSLVGIVQKNALQRIWGTQQDITEHRRMEDQLRQAQKMEAIGQLAGGVAHDFNNLLTAMLGSAEMLLAGLGPADPRLEDASDIKQAASRAAALTRQLLAFGRRQVLKPQVLDLNRVVSDMQRLLRRLIPEDIELVTRRAEDLWLVLMDRSQLEQVLVNLVVNARDAMPDGGVIMIETGNLDLDASFATRNPGAAAGPHVSLTVRDTGHGMDAETRAHIFEPFFTTKEVGKGTGLGLATVYGIVKQSGGYITVQSELRVGTSFQIYLPRCPEGVIPAEPAATGVAEAETTEPVADLRGGTETILIAEDEERIRISAKRILEYYGYRVLLVPDGQAALELLDQTPVDLVVSDVVMPRMNGPQLYQAVRERGSAVRFLFTSGYVGREGRSDVKIDPTVPFLPKPWTVNELVTTVRRILDVKT